MVEVGSLRKEMASIWGIGLGKAKRARPRSSYSLLYSCVEVLGSGKGCTAGPAAFLSPTNILLTGISPD